MLHQSSSDAAPASLSAGADCVPTVCKNWGPVPPPPHGWTWERLMECALDEARLALHDNEIPVGAIVVAPDGTVIGRGHNQPVALNDPSAHAEIMALRDAGRQLANYRVEHCTLVVTLEPCLMCTGAIVHARLAGLVYGAADDRAGAVTSCFNGLDLPFLNHRVWHMGGIASASCAALLHDFFRAQRNGGL